MAEASGTVEANAGAWLQQAAGAAMRGLIVVHRYLGMALSLVMTLWCLSGFVMMYQSFPVLTAAERLGGLAPLSLAGCCDPARIGYPDELAVPELRVEMLAGAPVVRFGSGFGPPTIHRLPSGERMGQLSAAEAAAVARDFGREAGIRGAPGAPRPIDRDQWSVATADRNAPVYRVSFSDPARTDIYVSGSTGQVFQDTNRRERLLSWFGAVPHWLYPTELRRNGPLWSQIVIWTSVLGTFLTVLGMWIGVVRFRRRRSGRWSPYRGLMWQHHVPGLVFGALALTWVFSGLLTMGPGGFLESSAGQARRALLGEVSGAEAKALLARAPALAAGGVKQLEMAPLGGEGFLVAHGPAGPVRYDAEGRRAPVTAEALRQAAAAAGLPVQSLTLMDREDGYYYGHHASVELPVYRLILADAGETHLYVDPRTGKVLRAVDAPARTRRWLETALHDLDLPGLRTRPVWDIVVLPLLAGVTFVCATGFWLGLRRLKHDLGRLRRRA